MDRVPSSLAAHLFAARKAANSVYELPPQRKRLTESSVTAGTPAVVYPASYPDDRTATVMSGTRQRVESWIDAQ